MTGTNVEDDLLDLGIDSAMAVGISVDLSEACGLDLPPDVLLTNPTAVLVADFVSSTLAQKQQLASGGAEEEGRGDG